MPQLYVDRGMGGIMSESKSRAIDGATDGALGGVIDQSMDGAMKGEMDGYMGRLIKRWTGR